MLVVESMNQIKETEPVEMQTRMQGNITQYLIEDVHLNVKNAFKFIEKSFTR